MEQPGKIARWNYNDDEQFDEEQRACAACGEVFVVGQRVQERPAFSLHFYHTDTKDCRTLQVTG